MAETKNIIFDLGGVLLDINYQKTIAAFEKLGMENFGDMFSQFKADALFEKLETGELSDTDFYSAIKKRTKSAVTNTEIDHAWNALILHFRIESLNMLEKLLIYKCHAIIENREFHVCMIFHLMTLQKYRLEHFHYL